MHSVSARAWMRVAPACVCPRVISTFCSELQVIIAGCQKSVRKIGFLWTKNDSILSIFNRVIWKNAKNARLPGENRGKARAKIAKISSVFGVYRPRCRFAGRLSRVKG